MPSNVPTKTDEQSVTQSGILRRPELIDQILERETPPPPAQSEWLGEGSKSVSAMSVEEGEDSSALRDDDEGRAG